MKKFISLLLFALSYCLVVNAQDRVLFDKFGFVDPSVFKIGLKYSERSLGFENSPKTFYSFVDYNFWENSFISSSVSFDKDPNADSLKLHIGYNHLIRLSSSSYFWAGVGGYIKQANYNTGTFNNPSDPDVYKHNTTTYGAKINLGFKSKYLVWNSQLDELDFGSISNSKFEIYSLLAGNYRFNNQLGIVLCEELNYKRNTKFDVSNLTTSLLLGYKEFWIGGRYTHDTKYSFLVKLPTKKFAFVLEFGFYTRSPVLYNDSFALQYINLEE